MKTFNVNLDQELNNLAIAFVNGDREAGELFVEKIQPLLKKYASKFHTQLDNEDLTQEFMLVAIEKVYDFVGRYNNGTNNVLGLIYTACKRKAIDILKESKAEKRSRKMKIGDEEVNREISLQTPIGEDGEMTLAEKIASPNTKSVEEQVIDKINENVLSRVVSDFVLNTKGRNGKIVQLVYKATCLDWSQKLLNYEISKILKEETGSEPSNDAIRQAKSRAIKALRKAIEAGKITVVNKLEC